MSVRVEVVTDSGAVLAGTLTDESVERLRAALGITTTAPDGRGLVTLAQAADVLGVTYDAARKAATAAASRASRSAIASSSTSTASTDDLLPRAYHNPGSPHRERDPGSTASRRH